MYIVVFKALGMSALFKKSLSQYYSVVSMSE